MAFKDYYKILGFDSNKVSIAEIKIAYREQAKKYHPDINKGNEEYESIFKDIKQEEIMILRGIDILRII